jgi:hypothetical protein
MYIAQSAGELLYLQLYHFYQTVNELQYGMTGLIGDAPQFLQMMISSRQGI